jgi:hypothetical protein
MMMVMGVLSDGEGADDGDDVDVSMPAKIKF